MAVGLVRFQVLKTMPRAVAISSTNPTTSLYRGIRNNFEFFTPRTAERLKVLQDKWDRALKPSFLDKLRKTVTGRPFIMPCEAREFEKLRSIACAQSFSDNEQVAMSFAGNSGYLLKLTMPLTESWKYMQTRSLMVDDCMLPMDVYFIPPSLLMASVSSGDWTLTIRHLGY